MSRTRLIGGAMLVALTAVPYMGCHKDATGPGASNTSLGGVIAQGSTMVPVVDKAPKVTLDTSYTSKQGPDSALFACTVRTVTLDQGNSDFALFNPQASVVYPGSLLQGVSLQNATPDVIPVGRAGGYVSIDLLNGTTKARFYADTVSKSAIAQALNNIIASNDSGAIVPSNFSFDYEEVQSEQQLAFKLGFNVGGAAWGNVGGHFNLHTAHGYTSYLVRLKQSYFTMSFDIPTSTAGLFAPDVTPSELGQYVQAGNPATYISDVTYGRIFYLLITSTSDSATIDAAIHASLNFGADSLGVHVSVHTLNTLQNRSIQITAFGGSSASTFQAISQYQDLGSLVSRLGEAADIRSGVPISYVVRNALDNSIVRVELTTTYGLKECTPVVPTPIANPIFDFSAMDTTNFVFSTKNAGQHWTGLYGPTIVLWANGVGNGNDAYTDDHFGAGSVYTLGDKPIVAFAAGYSPDPTLIAGIGTSLGFSGQQFEGSDYTIIAVVRELTADGTSGCFLCGSDPTAQMGLRLYWNTFVPGTNTVAVSTDGKPCPCFVTDHEPGSSTLSVQMDPSQSGRSQFSVYTIRFSHIDGTSIFINGQPAGSNSNAKTPVTSFANAEIGSGSGGVLIRELLAWGAAATDPQRIEEEQRLRLKWGI
jgi:hypothetical protein